jgi:hypothetical protein
VIARVRFGSVFLGFDATFWFQLASHKFQIFPFKQLYRSFCPTFSRSTRDGDIVFDIS